MQKHTTSSALRAARRQKSIGRVCMLAAVLTALAAPCVFAQPTGRRVPQLADLRGDAHVTVRPNISLGSHPLQALDLYIPDKPNGAAVLAIHGGGWHAGDKRGMRLLATVIATHGFVVAAVNYRLAPQFHWPVQLQDCQLAIQWLTKHADELGIKPDRIGAIGSSAGGHLTAMLTLVDGELARAGKVAAGCNYFGPSDLRIHARQNGYVWRVLTEFIGKPIDQAPELYKQASPITWVDPKDPPLQICQGKLDRLVPPVQATKLYEALKQKGVPTELIMLDHQTHGFIHKMGRDPEVTNCVRRSIAWLKKWLIK